MFELNNGTTTTPMIMRIRCFQTSSRDGDIVSLDATITWLRRGCTQILAAQLIRDAWSVKYPPLLYVEMFFFNKGMLANLGGCLFIWPLTMNRIDVILLLHFIAKISAQTIQKNFILIISEILVYIRAFCLSRQLKLQIRITSGQVSFLVSKKVITIVVCVPRSSKDHKLIDLSFEEEEPDLFDHGHQQLHSCINQ